MEPTDIVGYVLDGRYYCVDCPPTDPRTVPVRALNQDHEDWESQVCATCEERLGWAARPD